MLSDTSLTDGAFVAVDIETTGGMPGRNGIIELGAARIEDGRIVGTFGELVEPGEVIPYAIQLLTGITDRMVADAPPIAAVFDRFRAFAEDAVLIAHNYRFDLGFLDYYAEVMTGLPFPRPVLDTLALAKKLRPDIGKYNLTLLSSLYGVETRPNHRADADARATAEVFLGMVPELTAAGMRTVGETARYCRMGGQQSLAHKLVITTGLPDVPGVYLLRNARGKVIYVGRAKNLRLRLRSYFYVNSEASGPRLGDETVSVQHVPCHSALDSILLQSRLINRYKPVHNVTSQRGDVASLIYVDTSVRFPALRVSEHPRSRGLSFGPFVNRWAVESLVEQLREVYGLRRCSARITKRAAEIACAFRERGECPSPCVGGIDPDEYQRRLTEALSVFDRSSGALRDETAHRLEEAQRLGRHEDAIHYRDALRALDRALSSLDTVREASGRFGSVIMEVDDGAAALHLIRYGYLAKTVRLRRDDCATDVCAAAVRRAIHRAYYMGAYVDNPMEYTSQQLKDVFLIANHRKQTSPVEIDIGPDEDATVAAVMAAVRRHLRVPRKRHVLSSTV
jgi:DNA polymerase-3 subunit epsilon